MTESVPVWCGGLAQNQNLWFWVIWDKPGSEFLTRFATLGFLKENPVKNLLPGKVQMGSKRKNFSFFILGVLFFLNIISWIAVRDFNKPKGLEINFFDVGQGDAIFVVSPQSHQILIDGGPDSTILEKLAREVPFWDRTIDLIILTHPEKDHLRGLIETLKRYKVENILWTGVARNTPEYLEWIKVIEKEKAKIEIAKTGQKIKLLSSSRATAKGKEEDLSSSIPDNFIYFDILYPFDELSGENFENSNDTSIVTNLVFNDNTFVFTGDISATIEKKIILANFQLKPDVLKVSHHGSKYSTSDYFLENTLPEIAVIQVGKNSYGHPTKEVLERLEKFGIKVLRTDEKGDIKIISDGENLKIKSQR